MKRLLILIFFLYSHNIFVSSLKEGVMDYENLEVCKNHKSACDNCLREFRPGEVISVGNGGDLIFCYSDSGGGCAIAYVFSSGKMLACSPMKFRDAKLPDSECMPNYPNTPIHSQKPGWLKNLLGSILKKSP